MWSLHSPSLFFSNDSLARIGIESMVKGYHLEKTKLTVSAKDIYLNFRCIEEEMLSESIL